MTRDGKPLELPGLYWDEERRRYFPIASRAKRKSIDEVAQPAYTDVKSSQWRRTVTSRYLQISRAGKGNFSQRLRLADDLEGLSLVNSYTELDPSLRPLTWQSSKIASFCTATTDDTLNVLVGDSRGVLHCSRAVNKTMPGINAGPDRFNDNSRLFTSYHLGSGSPIVKIATCGNLVVAVSNTCDSCLLAIRDLKAPDYSGVSFPRIDSTGDIRAASLLDKSLVLGMSNKLVWLQDVQSSIRNHRTLHTRSDVLSIVQSPNTITAGLRSGEVRLFDVRTRGDASTELIGSRYSKRSDWELGPSKDMKSRMAHAAVTHLQGVGDWEMLVGTSSGELEMFDLRFATGTRVEPTMSFKGHVNSYLLDLGITIDPTSSILFAAGQDRRIRAWSLKSGEQLGTVLGGAQLASPARALAVTQRDNNLRGGKWLWISQEDEIRVLRLGQPSS
ncbi:hypothetical protein A7U60_g4636 [Sanghuangporus baumii]|uniref:Uncharacterized protein n=1 Tax=Sanghuangporus baumii TaxID=108892 RepID=A0A9Q5N8Z4_SANBA|nr:hypothetical protein A7U60_g4636 [Sanghuangporus baumii]